MAYGTEAGFEAYAEARGLVLASGDIGQALMRASDMVRLRYVPNLLPGYGVDFTPTGSDLPLVEEAAYIAASFELATPGFFSKTYTEAEQKVLTEVKGIKWTVTGKTSGVYSAFPSSSLIDALFWPYITDADANGFMLQSIGRSSCL
jgi:hypothetical protein